MKYIAIIAAFVLASCARVVPVAKFAPCPPPPDPHRVMGVTVDVALMPPAPAIKPQLAPQGVWRPTGTQPIDGEVLVCASSLPYPDVCMLLEAGNYDTNLSAYGWTSNGWWVSLVSVADRGGVCWWGTSSGDCTSGPWDVHPTEHDGVYYLSQWSW